MVRVMQDFYKVGHVQRLKFQGVFDLDTVYSKLHGWLLKHGYEFHETQYKHKVPTPSGAEQEMEWIAWKKVNGYVQFWIETYFHLFDAKEVEVIVDGQKKKMWHGKLVMEMWGKLELDYSERFKGAKFIQQLQDFYHKYVVKEDIENIWQDELYYRVLKYHHFAKELLDLETTYNAARGRW